MTATALEIITTKPETIPVFKIENFAELKTALSDELTKYKGLVYTDETMPEAKKDRAKLNAFKERLNKARIAQKKAALLNQYEVFEKQCRELEALVLEPISKIDTQIKAYEEKQKAEKTIKLRELYFKYFDGIKGFADFDLVLKQNEKWLNLTCSLKRAEDEMSLKAENIKKDLVIISNHCKTDDIKKLALLSYSRDLTLNNAIMTADTETKRLAELEAALAEKERREAEEKAKAEQAEAGKRQTEQALAQPPIEPPEMPIATDQDKPRRRIDFSVWATKEEALMIRQFLIDAKIKYSAVFTKDDRLFLRDVLEEAALNSECPERINALLDRF